MRRPTIRRVVAASLTVAAAFGVTSCGVDQSSPEGLGEAVANAANDEDPELIQELACKKDRSSFKTDFDFDKMRSSLNAEDLTFDVEFVKAVTKGNAATLTFKTTFENMPAKLKDMGMPSSSQNDQNAIKEGDTWVICN